MSEIYSPSVSRLLDRYYNPLKEHMLGLLEDVEKMGELFVAPVMPD